MKIVHSNSKAIKIRFAINFVSAMKRLNKSRSMTRDRCRRYRAVRAAASASMASAVGPGRAWSRAVLRRMKSKRLIMGRKRSSESESESERRNPSETLGFGEEEDLRCLVPGGQEMGFCSLLSETAHYIKCLQLQVQVMTDILNTSSS